MVIERTANITIIKWLKTLQNVAHLLQRFTTIETLKTFIQILRSISCLLEMNMKRKVVEN